MRHPRCPRVLSLSSVSSCRCTRADTPDIHHPNGRLRRSGHGALPSNRHQGDGPPHASRSEPDQSLGGPHAQYAEYRGVGWWGLHPFFWVSPLPNHRERPRSERRGWADCYCRFHYKPSAAWPPLAGDGITVTMPDGTDRHFDEQIQMYWYVRRCRSSRLQDRGLR
jgi:hypothetical protein